MHRSDPNQDIPARRKLLGGMVSAAALLGLNATGAAAASTNGVGGIAPPPGPESEASEKLLYPARLRTYKARRSSSWDRTGGNDDAVPV